MYGQVEKLLRQVEIQPSASVPCEQTEIRNIERFCLKKLLLFNLTCTCSFNLNYFAMSLVHNIIYLTIKTRCYLDITQKKCLSLLYQSNIHWYLYNVLSSTLAVIGLHLRPQHSEQTNDHRICFLFCTWCTVNSF